MALTIGELVGYIDLDNKGWRRGLRETHDDLQKVAHEVNAFGDQAGAKFLSVANSVSNIPTAIQGIAGVMSILGEMSGAIGLILQRQLGEWVAASFVVAESGLVLTTAAPA